jgi:hypothetical protein
MQILRLIRTPGFSRVVCAGHIGFYLAVIVLPWAFKLITGPLMDCDEFLSMG